jgi:hypothetical protein
MKENEEFEGNSGSCRLIVASKEEKTFLDIITSLGVLRSSIKYRTID